MATVIPFSQTQTFKNKRGESISIKTRYFTPENKFEYLVVCGSQKARVSHEKILDRVNGGEWEKIK